MCVKTGPVNVMKVWTTREWSLALNDGPQRRFVRRRSIGGLSWTYVHTLPAFSVAAHAAVVSFELCLLRFVGFISASLRRQRFKSQTRGLGFGGVAPRVLKVLG